MKKHLREFISRLEDMGCVNIQYDQGTHYKVYFNHPANRKRQSVILAGTPRDPDSAVIFSIEQVRKMLGLTSAGKPARSGHRKPRTYSQRPTEAFLALPKPIADLGDHDGFRALLGHPVGFQNRVERAWLRFWRHCMRVVGEKAGCETNL